jgi:DNA-binding CsgD family transcriptional regulator
VGADGYADGPEGDLDGAGGRSHRGGRQHFTGHPDGEAQLAVEVVAFVVASVMMGLWAITDRSTATRDHEGLALLLGLLPDIDVVAAAANGQEALDLVAVAQLPEELPDGLTHREAEILSMIARGATNPAIAADLYLSAHTVKSHINRIFAKTGSADRAAAVRYARDHGLS